MDPKENEAILDLYTQEISSRALKDAEKYLETSGRGNQKELLLAKVLAEEQKVENNRKILENLKAENNELKIDLTKCDLKSLETMRAERDELQRKREAEKDEVSVSQKSIEMIQQLTRQIEKIRGAFSQKTTDFMED
ncbi:hypothetical protein CAEBREN_00633 [Caenorhabditis brenneri]|uniref:Uncharacterized protein n=1 Tax=Caenorhabditis brenneri TaxID=135651 RepID=G0NH86_CAEBE|nr:hypothetical protein CAEBREN_00633 [Caenorhabditis brenneri]